YRARADGLDRSVLGRLADAGATRFELDEQLSPGVDAESGLLEKAQRLGLDARGTRIEAFAAGGGELKARARFSNRELDLAIVARRDWPSADPFTRWHPCTKPTQDLAAWVDGSVFVCHEQSRSLDDTPQGDWQQDGLVATWASAPAQAFRQAHAAAGQPLPEPCRLCPHPARPWQMEMRRRLMALRDLHRGQRCFILGNGPSLHRIDLTKLKGEVTFGANRIHEAYDAFGLDPVTYYGVSDPAMWRLLGRDPSRAKARAVFLRHPDIDRTESEGSIFLSQHDPELTMDGGWFPADIGQGLVRGRTVILDLLIPLAFHMGFYEVYLIGCDFGHEPGQPGHFYPSSSNDFQHDPKFQNYDPPYDAQRAGMKIARRHFEAAGRSLIDATPQSRVEVLERRHFDDLFSDHETRS
ncbi:MAG: hypothetical protein KDB53_07955, partial [Planctomycetes bacterium]|nr:hypothetical protein [Planctomycetota bacterium]